MSWWIAVPVLLILAGWYVMLSAIWSDRSQANWRLFGGAAAVLICGAFLGPLSGLPS